MSSTRLQFLCADFIDEGVDYANSAIAVGECLSWVKSRPAARAAAAVRVQAGNRRWAKGDFSPYAR